MPDQQQQTDPIEKLYKTLNSKGYYTKSLGEFKNQYNSPESIDKIYSIVERDSLYTKGKDEFYSQYFPTVKKKDVLSEAGSAFGGKAGTSKVLSADVEVPVLKTKIQEIQEKNKQRERKAVEDYSYSLKTPEQKQLSKETPQTASNKAYNAGQERLQMIMAGNPNDPLGQAKKRAEANTDVQDGIADYMAARVIEDDTPGSMAKELVVAGKYKPETETGKFLAKRAEQYDKVAQPFREIFSGEIHPDGDTNAKDKLYNAAIRAYANKNPNFRKSLEATGVKLTDENLHLKLGDDNTLRGQVLNDIFSDKDFVDYLEVENPDLYNQAKNTWSNLLTDNKQFGVNVIANEISKKRQELGFNNPVVELDDKNFRKENDLVAQSLYGDDPVKMQLYTDILSKDPDKYIDTPSLFEGFAHGAEGVYKGIANTFTEPFRSTETSIKRSWQKEASHVSADPKGITKFFNDTGHVLGLVAAIGGTSNVLGGGGVGTYSSKVVPALSGGVLPFMGDMLEEGRKKYPGSPVKAWTSALVNTTMYAALSQHLFPVNKINQAIGKVKPQMTKITERLANGEISREVARQEANTLFKEGLDFVKGTTKKSATIAADLSAITAFNRGLDKIMMDDDSFDQFHPEGEVGDTFKSMFLSNLALGGITTFGKQKNANRVAKETYYELASNPKRYEAVINNSSVDKSFGTINELKENLNHISTLKKDLDKKGFTPDAQKEFIFQSLREKVAKETAEASKDNTLIKQQKEIVKEAEEIKEKILAGENPETIVTEAEQKRIDELQKLSGESKDVDAEIDKLRKNKELDNKEIDVKLSGLEKKDNPLYQVQKERLEQQREEYNDYYDSATDKLMKKKGDLQMKQGRLDETFLKQQALDAPKGLKTQLGSDEAVVEIIAKNEPAEIESAIKKWEDRIRNEDVTAEEGDKHISLLEKGLEIAQPIKETKQAEQSKSPTIEQKNPFPESKVQEPVYRASTGGRFGVGKGAVYFTSNKKYAESYAEDLKGNKTGEVTEHFVDLQNPLEVSMQKDYSELASGALEARAKREGYDGIIAKDETGNVDEIVVFDKSKIKSTNEQTPSKGSVSEEGGVTEQELMNGEQVVSIQDAETRLSNGERIFVSHEMDEVPFEVRSVEELKGYEPTTMIAIQPIKDPFAKPEQKTVNLQSDAKAGQNISGKENKGTSNSTQSLVEESPENLAKRYKRVTDENDFVDPYDIAVKYFADGGRINPAELERIFGGKGDKGARISLMKNNAGTVKQIAHRLWEADKTGKYEDTHYIDAVESALRDFPSKSAMQKDLADRYDLQGAYEKYMTQSQGKEAIDIVERMTEEEMNAILQMEADKNTAEKVGKYIDSLIQANEPSQETTKGTQSKQAEEKPQPETTTIEDSKGAAEPPKPPTEAKASIYVERPATELSHRGLQVVANEFSLPDVKTRDRKSDVQLRQDAINTANEWAEKGEYATNVERLIKEAEAGEILTDKERVILERHLANLSGELRGITDKSSPEFDAKLKEIHRLKMAGEKTRSEAGAALRLPGGGSRPHPISDYADAMVTMKEAVGEKDLTPEQKGEVEKMVSKYEQRAKDAEQKVAEMEVKYAELQAKKGVEKAKKSKQEYKSERDKLRASIKDKWNNAGRDILSSDLPFRKQLAAIAPDVARLVKSYVQEGITEFSEVVKKVHEFIKEFNEDIQESDVVNLLAGKYDEVKETKGDLVKKLKGIKDKNSAEAIKIRARIKAGDFEKKELPKTWVMNKELKEKYPKEYKEAIDALEAKEQAKLDFDIAVYKQERAKRSTTRKGIDFVRALIATTKAVKSGIDDSAVMVQNAVAMISHPRSAAKALKEHAFDALSEKRFRRYLTELHNSPIWDLIQKSGLDITDPKSLKEQNKEEIFDNNLLNKDIKIGKKKYNIGKYVTRPFERAFTSLGNAMRVNMFTRISERMIEEGKTFETHPEEYKSLARVLNTETGRGKLHTQIERASQLVTAGIWSPRLMASRINMLGLSELAPLYGGKGYYSGLTPTMRKMAIADMVKFLGVGISLMAFAGSRGAEIDDDPESPTFGTIKVGNKKYNAWGGTTPYAKTVYQGISGHRNIQGERKAVTKGKLLGSFFRSRLTPAAGVTTNLLVGRDFSGKPVTATGEIKNLVLPLSVAAISDAVKKDGMTGVLTQGIPSFVGIGVSDERDFPPKTMKIKDPETYVERDATPEEFQKFKDLRDEKIPQITKEYENQETEMYIDVNGKLHLSKGSTSNEEFDTWKEITPQKLDKEQRKKFEQLVKNKADREAKKELFGEEN